MGFKLNFNYLSSITINNLIIFNQLFYKSKLFNNPNSNVYYKREN